MTEFDEPVTKVDVCITLLAHHQLLPLNNVLVAPRLVAAEIEYFAKFDFDYWAEHFSKLNNVDVDPEIALYLQLKN